MVKPLDFITAEMRLLISFMIHLLGVIKAHSLTGVKKIILIINKKVVDNIVGQ